jgi:hypothetical protein
VFRKCSLQHEIVVGQDSRGYKLLWEDKSVLRNVLCGIR